MRHWIVAMDAAIEKMLSSRQEPVSSGCRCQAYHAFQQCKSCDVSMHTPRHPCHTLPMTCRQFWGCVHFI
jgi:hypothetical protein